jgi:hypothetical protein
MRVRARQLVANVVSGEWLTPERVLGYCATLLVFEVLAFIYFIALANGLVDAWHSAAGNDFVSFYAAGRLAQDGAPTLAYDRAAHYGMEQLIAGANTTYNFFYYPPIFLILCSFLAKLPYAVALVAFEMLTLLAYLWIGRKILADYKVWFVIVLLAFPAVFWNALLGQNALLTASLLGAGLMLLERRPVLAGFILGALAYKPHFGLLLPIALIASHNWRAFFAAAGSVALLVAFSIVLFGWETWQAYLSAAAGSAATYESGAVDLVGLATPFGAAMVLGAAPSVAYAVQAIATVAAAVWVGYVWQQEISLPLRAATLLAAIPITVPIFQYYDLAIIAIAMAFLVKAPRQGGRMPLERMTLAILYVACLFTGYTNATPRMLIPPAIAAAFFLLVAARAKFELASRAAPALAAPVPAH